ADVRIGALHDLAVHLQDQAQHAMRGRVLRAEVHGVVADFLARLGRVAGEGAAGWNGAGLNRAHRAAPAGPMPLSILRSWSSPRAVAERASSRITRGTFTRGSTEVTGSYTTRCSSAS